MVVTAPNIKAIDKLIRQRQLRFGNPIKQNGKDLCIVCHVPFTPTIERVELSDSKSASSSYHCPSSSIQSTESLTTPEKLTLESRLDERTCKSCLVGWKARAKKLGAMKASDVLNMLRIACSRSPEFWKILGALPAPMSDPSQTMEEWMTMDYFFNWVPEDGFEMMGNE